MGAGGADTLECIQTIVGSPDVVRSGVLLLLLISFAVELLHEARDVIGPEFGVHHRQMAEGVGHWQPMTLVWFG